MLNVKVTKALNADFRLKMEAWTNRAKERKVVKKRNFEHGKALREMMAKNLESFSMDKERMQACINQFNEFAEDLQSLTKDNKIINNFLTELSDASNHLLKLEDFDVVTKNITNANTQRKSMIDDFITAVKQECVLNQHFFSFFDIPDLIVKRQISRKDYEGTILKLLLKVKGAYLAKKIHESDTDTAKADVKVTDDDLVELELLD